MLRTQPTRSAFTQPWFDACQRGELLIQRCDDCGHYQFYPRIFCTQCDSSSLSWVVASGLATVSSFTIVRRPISKAYEAPYVVCLVQLAEGPTMMSQLVDIDPEQVRIGQSVRVRFESWGDDVALPVFTPIDEQEDLS